MLEEITKKYYRQLAKEAWINAILAALIVGFSALFVTALGIWMFAVKAFWIAFIVFAVVVAGCAPLFYFKKYRPSKKQVAKRVDALGLEERLLTMTELEGDNSYMAVRQREDAKKAIASIQSQRLKIVASLPLLIVSCILLPCSLGMSAVAVASAFDKVSSGKDFIEDATKPEPIIYVVEFVEVGGGILEGGELTQFIEEGGTIETMFAIPDDEWYFVEWSWTIGTETYTLAETDEFFVADLKVEQDLVITATFAEMSDGESGDSGDGEGEGEQQESEADSAENEPQEGEGEQQESENQEGEEGDNDEEKQPDDTPPNDGQGDGAGGKPQDKDKIIDGETDYGGEVYEEHLKDAQDELEANDEIPDGDKDIVEDYFDNIKK